MENENNNKQFAVKLKKDGGAIQTISSLVLPNAAEKLAAFVELDKKKAEYKKFIEDYTAARDAVVLELGLGATFQDADGTVYETGEPNGRFVYYEKSEIKRTRRTGETKGSLSMSDARNAGFTVEGK